jgi:hypothetical protein
MIVFENCGVVAETVMSPAQKTKTKEILANAWKIIKVSHKMSLNDLPERPARLWMQNRPRFDCVGIIKLTKFCYVSVNDIKFGTWMATFEASLSSLTPGTHLRFLWSLKLSQKQNHRGDWWKNRLAAILIIWALNDIRSLSVMKTSS